MKKILIFLLFSTIIISCSKDKDIDNIVIKGTLFNKYTHKPIKNKDIRIEIDCWKYGNSPDESYAEHQIKNIKIDSNGNYTVSFNKGAFIVFRVNTNEYGSHVSNLYVTKSKHTYDIELSPLR